MVRFFTMLCCAFTAVGSSTCHAGEATDSPNPVDMSKIIQVEEDWIVYVKNPDAELGAPQIAHVISPTRATNGVFGMVELNHRSQPDFRKGGFQVQTWIGDENVDRAISEDIAVLSSTYDKMRYTVGMKASGTSFEVFVSKGRSRTWGKFGDIPITAGVQAADANLKEYDPQYSVDNTTVNLGAHRVVLMYLATVRYYTAEGLTYTDETPRVIHRYQQIVQDVSLEEYEKNLADYNIDIAEQ